MYSAKFVQILCIILSIIYVKANVKYPLGVASEHYRVDTAAPTLEAGLNNQDVGGQDQLYLQQLIGKWRLANPATQVAASTGAIAPSTAAIAPSTAVIAPSTAAIAPEGIISSSTLKPTTTITTSTIGTESNHLYYDKNNLAPTENSNLYSMALYPAPFFHYPIYAAIYPLAAYNVPNRIPQITQTVPGGNGFSHSISTIGQPVAGGQVGVAQTSSVSQLPQHMLSMSGVSYMSGYNPVPMQFAPPVHYVNGPFKK